MVAKAAQSAQVAAPRLNEFQRQPKSGAAITDINPGSYGRAAPIPRRFPGLSCLLNLLDTVRFLEPWAMPIQALAVGMLKATCLLVLTVRSGSVADAQVDLEPARRGPQGDGTRSLGLPLAMR